MRKHLFTILLLLVTISLFAQERVSGIYFNPRVYNKYQEVRYSLKAGQADTLLLPFFDDFARGDVFPDENLWSDRNVFVNFDYAVAPPTLGVATFDAIDQTGSVYLNASTSPFTADYLTSRPINLKDHLVPDTNSYRSDSLFTSILDTMYYISDGLYWYIDDTTYVLLADSLIWINISNLNNLYIISATDTIQNQSDLYVYISENDEYRMISDSIWIDYTPQDSVFMSFWYQPQGIAYAPEAQDSLVLEFYSPSEGSWKWIWSATGEAQSDFRYKLIHIQDSMFLQNGFRFRFRNYASMPDNTVPSFAGNNDVWNLDCVYLNSNRGFSDSLLHDVAFIDPMKSTLRNYTSMPWTHYQYDDAEGTNIFSVRFKNYNDSAVHYDRFYDLVNRNAGIYNLRRNIGGSNDIVAGDIDTLGNLFLSSLFETSISDESALFELKTYLDINYQSVQDYHRWNDTAYHAQEFYNYYSYDDGTAEKGYGLFGAGSENASAACNFYIYKPDTLRGVQMFFNQTWGQANDSYFYLTVWKNTNGKPGSIIYQRSSESTEFTDSINEFFTMGILLDSLAVVDSSYLRFNGRENVIYIPDTSIFVGWQKIFTSEMLNVGLDMNNPLNGKIFYTYSGSWYASSVQGALMVRPVFGGRKIYHSTEEIQMADRFVVYPNPARNLIFVRGEAVNMENCTLQLFDMYGKESFRSAGQESIDVSEYSPGMYILVITDSSGYIQTNKIFIAR